MFFRGEFSGVKGVKTLLSFAAGILAAGWGSGASACGVAWLRGGRGDEDVGCILEGGVEVETAGGELACGTGTELDAL